MRFSPRQTNRAGFPRQTCRTCCLRNKKIQLAGSAGKRDYLVVVIQQIGNSAISFAELSARLDSVARSRLLLNFGVATGLCSFHLACSFAVGERLTTALPLWRGRE